MAIIPCPTVSAAWVKFASATLLPGAVIEEKSTSLHVVELKLNTRRGNTPGPREQSPANQYRGPGGSVGSSGLSSSSRSTTPAGSDVIRGEIVASSRVGASPGHANSAVAGGLAGVTTPPPPPVEKFTPFPNGPTTRSALPTSRRLEVNRKHRFIYLFTRILLVILPL